MPARFEMPRFVLMKLPRLAAKLTASTLESTEITPRSFIAFSTISVDPPRGTSRFHVQNSCSSDCRARAALLPFWIPVLDGRLVRRWMPQAVMPRVRSNFHYSLHEGSFLDSSPVASAEDLVDEPPEALSSDCTRRFPRGI